MVNRKTTEQFSQEVSDWTKGEYALVGEYVKSSVVTEIRHNICNRTFEMKPNKFQQGHRCPLCYQDSKVKTQDEFENDVRAIHGELIKVVSAYKGFSSQVELVCSKHGTRFSRLASTILRKEKRLLCPDCFGEYQHETQRKDIKLFIDQLTAKHDGKIKLVGEYVNTHTKAIFKCTECGTGFNSEPNSVLRISGCPSCAYSNGEKLIKDFLEGAGIEFEPQKRFEGLTSERQLSYDFYIPSRDIVIEYDGLQHDKPIDFFGGEEAFKKQVKHDELKTFFAVNNGLTLLRFKYNMKDEDVIELLSTTLDVRKAEQPLPN